MKKLLLMLLIGLGSSSVFAQDLCKAIDQLIKNAPNGFAEYKGEKIDDLKSKSKVEFPGAYRSNIENDNGKQVFKAYFEESNDKELLIGRYNTIAKDLKDCLSKKYFVEEKMANDGIGKMLVVRKKKGKANKVKIYLEFSKAELASASYYLRLTAHQDIN